MKIFFISPKYYPSIGGVETHVQKVAEQLSARGHQLTVVTTQSALAEPLEENTNSIKILRLPRQCDRQKKLTWQWLWSKKELFFSTDVVQAHDVGWWILPILPLIYRKLFITFHGWEGRWPIRWQAKLHRWFFAKASRKTVHIGAWIQEFYWDKPHLTLYGGVDRRKIARQINQKKTKHKKILNIVFIGRLVKENDIALYCQFLDLLQHKNQAFRIVWLGEGASRSQCEQYGFVTGMIEKPEFVLKKADVVFASSYLSILLARSLGKPVWSLYSHKLKQRYLETLPNTAGMTIAGNASDLYHSVYDEVVNNWRSSAITAHYSPTWPPTWEEVASAYEKLWQK